MTTIDLPQNPSSKRLELLEKSLQLLERELTWRQNNERFVFFEPNGKQKEFIDVFGSQDSSICVFSAANGLGKTTLLVNILGNVVFGAQNKFFDYEIFKKWPYAKRARYVTNPKLTEEIAPFHTEILKWWPRGQYEPIKAGKNYFSQYRANGWIIDIMSYDQDPSQFEGATLGLALFDEPPPESLWTPTIRGLRGKGKAGVFMTPLTHAAWFYDRIIPAHPKSVVYGSMEDSCREHGVRGHQEHIDIQRQIDEILASRPEELEARVHGKAMYLRGLIFKTFDPKVHVTQEPIKCPPTAYVYQVVDPHDDKPFAVTYAFPDSRGDLFVFDEWPNEDFYKMHNCQLNVDDYVKIFKDKEQTYHMHKRIMDRRFGEVSHANNRRTLREDFMSKGFLYDQSYSAQEEIETGILKVRKYLSYDMTKAVSDLNHPKLYISPTCTNTIKSLSRWARDPDTGKVQDEYKDFCDNLRYLTMEEPKTAEYIPHNRPNKYG